MFGLSNESLNNVHSAAFFGALLDEGKLCHRGPNNTVVWKLQQVNLWPADIDRSWSDVYRLMHFLSLAGRGTEEALYQWANGPEGCRHLFLYNTIMAIISNLGEWAIASHGKGTRPFMKVAAEAVYSKIS
jgi:hypothetical protein